MKLSFLIFTFLFLSSCMQDNKVQISGSKNKSSSASNISISNINVANNLFTMTGINLDKATKILVNDGSATKTIVIDSKSTTSLIAKASANLTLAAGKVFTFVITDANAATTTFTVDFSLCSSTLGTKVFDCSVVPNDKEVLSYDAASGKWKPRAVNGLSYLGAFDASSGTAPTAKPAGSYYIVSIAGTIGVISFEVGDWIVSTGAAWQKISNSQAITSVMGRTGAVTATKGDYVLDKLGDVDLTTTAPVNGNVLKYNGVKWIPGTVTTTESDPTVMAFAKSVLPTCSAGQVLKSDGTNFSCVTDNTGAGSFTGTANRVVTTDGAGVLTTSAISDTVLGYLSGVTSNIQTQLNSKISSYTETDPSVLTFAKTVLPLCNAGEVLNSDGVNLNCVTDLTGTYIGTPNRLVLTDGSTGALTTSSVTNTEVGYLSGVTSSIQTQLNAKQGTIDKTTTQPVSKVRVYGANANNYVELSAGTLSANRSLIFPDANGSSGNVLSTDGSGNLSWIAIPSAPVTTVAGRTGAVTLTTSDVSEGSNLYHTDARVLGTPITAPTLTNSTIATSDTVQVALGKLQGQFNNILSLALTGLSTATNAVITTSDTIVGAFGKLQKQITDLSAQDANKLNKNTADSITATITVSGAGDVIVPSTPAGMTSAVNKTYVDNLVATGTNQWTASSGNVYRTTGNVGVGTASPTNAFQVLGVTNYGVAEIIGNGTNVESSLGFRSSNVTKGGSGNWIIGVNQTAAVTGNFNIWSGGVSGSVFSITPAGNVGIGTTSPQANLDIAGTTSTIRLNRLSGSGNNGTLSVNGTIRTHAGPGASNFGEYSFDDNDLYLSSNVVSNSYRGNIILQPNKTGAGTQGFVGIGTTSPTSTLQVVGGTPTVSIGPVASGSANASLILSGVNSGSASSASIWADYQSNLNFQPATSRAYYFRDGSGTERMRLDAAGNLGIGTTSPTTNLMVVGDSGVTSLYGNSNDIRLNFDLPNFAYATINARNKANNASRNLILQDLGGNVGIGITSPSSLLHAYQNTSADLIANFNNVYSGKGAYVQTNANSSFSGFYSNSSASTQGWFTGMWGTTEFKIRDNSNSVAPFIVQSGTPTNTMVLTANGNVGIGTGTPADRLHVTGAAMTTFTGTGAGTLMIDAPYGASGNQYRSIDFTHGGGPQAYARIASLENSSGSYLQFGTSNIYTSGITNTAMTIDPNGNVGIGTTNPTYVLDVTGVARFTGGYTTSDARYKKNIEVLTSSLDKVLALRGVSYYFKTKEFPNKKFESKKQIGFIAQEVEKVIPEVVDTGKDGYKSINYTALISPLIEAFKDFYHQWASDSKEIKREITSVKNENKILKTEVEKLKKQENERVDLLKEEVGLLKKELCLKDSNYQFCQSKKLR